MSGGAATVVDTIAQDTVVEGDSVATQIFHTGWAPRGWFGCSRESNTHSVAQMDCVGFEVRIGNTVLNFISGKAQRACCRVLLTAALLPHGCLKYHLQGQTREVSCKEVLMGALHDTTTTVQKPKQASTPAVQRPLSITLDNLSFYNALLP